MRQEVVHLVIWVPIPSDRTLSANYITLPEDHVKTTVKVTEYWINPSFPDYADDSCFVAERHHGALRRL
jgi:hypothetical protein